MCFRWYQLLLAPLIRLLRARKRVWSGRLHQEAHTAPRGPGLIGTADLLSEEDLKILQEEDYHSLYEDRAAKRQRGMATVGICAGPISLLNHSCTSSLHLQLQGDRDLCLQSKEKGFYVPAGREIFINYGSSYFVEEQTRCRCSQCTNKRKRRSSKVS